MAATDTRVVLWAAAAVAACAAVAVAVGTSAGARPATLSDDDIARALAADGPRAASSGSDPGGTVGQSSGAVALQATPGTVTARCEEGLVTLQSWSPNPGYTAVSPAVRGPGPQASVRFQSDAGVIVTITVTCAGGRPVLQTSGNADGGPATGAGAGNGSGAEPGVGNGFGSGAGSGSGPGLIPGPGPGLGPGPAPTTSPSDESGKGRGGGGGGGGGESPGH
jgi:hypothetical protein